uniref:Uncharacterized protein n=1 Tax=Schistocephalus solidus TaxID=70667 RepID=A0A0X3PXK0_SCHSO
MGSGFSSNPGGSKIKHAKPLCSFTSNSDVDGLRRPAEAARNSCASNKEDRAKKIQHSLGQQPLPYEICSISEIDNDDPTLNSSDVSLHSLDSDQIICHQGQYCKHVNMNVSNHEEGGRSPSSTGNNGRPHKRSTIRTVTACTASTSHGKRISVYHSLAVTRGRATAPSSGIHPVFQRPPDPLAVFQRDLIDPYEPHPHPNLPTQLTAAPMDIIPVEGPNQPSPRTTPRLGEHTDTCILNSSRRLYSDGQGCTSAHKTEELQSGYQQRVNSPGLDRNTPKHSSTRNVYNRNGKFGRSASTTSQNPPSRCSAASPPPMHPAQIVVVSGTSMASHKVNRPMPQRPVSQTQTEGVEGVVMEKSVACIVSQPQIMTNSLQASLSRSAVQTASIASAPTLTDSSASRYLHSVVPASEMQNTVDLPTEARQQQQELLIQRLQQAGRKLAVSISRQQGLPVEGSWQDGAANSLHLQEEAGRASPLSFQSHTVVSGSHPPAQNAHLPENVPTPHVLPGPLSAMNDGPKAGGQQTVSESQQKVIVFTRPQRARRSLAMSQPVQTAVPNQTLKQVGRIENSLENEAVERNTEDGSEPVYENAGLWSPSQQPSGQNQYSQDPKKGQRTTGGTPSHLPRSARSAGTGRPSAASGTQLSAQFASTAGAIRPAVGSEYQAFPERGGFGTNQRPAFGSPGVKDQKREDLPVAPQSQELAQAGQPLDRGMSSRDDEQNYRQYAVSGPDSGTGQGVRTSGAVDTQQTRRTGMSQDPPGHYGIQAQRQVQFPNAQVAGRTVASGVPTQRAALNQPLHQASQRQHDIDEGVNITVDNSVDDSSAVQGGTEDVGTSPRQLQVPRFPGAQLAHTSTAPPIQTEHAMLDHPPLNRVVQREGGVQQEAIETFRQDDLDLQYHASYASSPEYEDEDGRLSPNAPAGRRAAQRQRQLQSFDRPNGQICSVEDDMEEVGEADDNDTSRANQTVLVRLESYDELPSEVSQHTQAKRLLGFESMVQRGTHQEGVSDQFMNEVSNMSTLLEDTEGRDVFYAPNGPPLERSLPTKEVIAQRAQISQIPLLPMAAKNKREDVYMATTVNQSPDSNAPFWKNRTDTNHLREPSRQMRKQRRSYRGDIMSGFAARQTADPKDPLSSLSSGGGRTTGRRARSCNPEDGCNLNPRLFYASSQSLSQDPRSLRELQRQMNNFSPLHGMFKNSSEPNSCAETCPRRRRPKKRCRRRAVSTDGDRPQSGGLKRRKWLRLFGVHKVGRPLDVSLKLYPAVISADGIAYKLEGPASEHVYHSPEPRLCDRKRYIQPCVYRPEDLRHTIYVFETAVLHQPMVFQGSFSRTELIRPPFEGPPPDGGPQGGGGGNPHHPTAGPSNAPTRNVKFLPIDQDSRTASQASTALLETRSGESVNNLLIKNNMQQSIQNVIPGLPPAAIDKAFREVDPNQSLAGFMVYSTAGNGQVAPYDPKNPQCCCLVPLYLSKQSNRNAGNSIDIQQYKTTFSPSILSSIGEDSVATQPEACKEISREEEEVGDD